MSIIGPSSPLSSIGSRIGLPSESGSSDADGDTEPGSSWGDDKYIPRTHAINIQLKDCVRLCVFNTKRTLVDEAWRELHSLLPESVFRDIVKLERVTFANIPPRIDMWVRGDMGASLVRHLREMTRERTPSLVRALKASGAIKDYRSLVTSGWRMAIWRSWRDRHTPTEPHLTEKRKEQARPSGFRLATFNVNGFPSKRLQVNKFLEEERITVCVLQETLVSAAQYPVLVPGFNTFAIPWQEGFRGMAILVDDRFAAYEVPHGKESTEGYKYLLHVKVSADRTKRPLHLVGVYLPSGGNMRSERRKGLSALTSLCDSVLRNEPGASFVALGDLNCGNAALDKYLQAHGEGLRRVATRGSGWTRFPKKGSPAALDHMLMTPMATSSFVRPRVCRRWALSDHRPLVSAMRVHNSAPSGSTCHTIRYDRRKMVTHSLELVNDNRWLPLQELDTSNAAKLSELAEEMSRTLKTVTEAHGIRVVNAPSHQKQYMPNRLKRLLKKYMKFSKRVADCLGNPKRWPKGIPPELLRLYEDARKKFRSEKKNWERREKQRHYTRIAEDFLVHDHKNVWSRLRSQIDTKHRGSTGAQPVRNKAGKLCVDADGILDATAEHYRSLAWDDPGGISRDAARWASITPDYPRKEEELEGLNDPLSWSEVILAIRAMNRDTAPGKCEMHVNLLKALVSEECQTEVFGPSKEDRPEFIRVALPKSNLPNVPLTPMGAALWKVLLAVWALEEIPGLWNEVRIVSLLKKGDPELLVNYRGISLISVSLKVLLVVMVNRLEKQISSGNIHISQAQSGFRKREEAIAQFLVMAETVRRRHLINLPTFGIFVDFKKAYDRVSHEGLYRILEHRGVRGKYLNLIKAMYRNSQMTVRACGKLSDPFDMRRGNRQGCPLSPLLFIIFIDHILMETNPKEGGLKVPTVGKKASMNSGFHRETPIEVDGGLYADDLVCFEDTLENTKLRCEKLVQWGEKWGMEQNFEKCGIILWSYDEALRQTYDDAEFETTKGIFPKVTSYKYLGIEVTADLPVFMGSDPRSQNADGRTDAYRHALSRANRGLQVLSTLKPILCDRFCPTPLKVELVRTFVLSVMTYGGEFIGFNKKNVAPIQRVMDLATRWIVGVKKSNKRVAGLTLSLEMGLPLVYEYMAGMRARLFHKLKFGVPKMQTYLPVLQQDHRFHPNRTWCSENELWLKSVHGIRQPRKGAQLATGGVNKYAPKIVTGKTLWVQDIYRHPISRELDEDQWQKVVDDVTEWWLSGQEGDSPWGSKRSTLENFTLVTLDSSAPIRSWYAFARICELHRRSNPYQSDMLRQHRRMMLGVDESGRVLLDPRDLPAPILRDYLEKINSIFTEDEATVYADNYHKGFPWMEQDGFQDERDLQDAFLGNVQSDDSARRLFVREVRECALERIMDVDGGRTASFTNWYNKFQFGATRDFLRTSLGRPDLVEGVRLLMLVRVGGFPRSASFKRRLDPLINELACPLCEGRVEDGWDWAHLALTCRHPDIVQAREAYLEPALQHLHDKERMAVFYERWPGIPESLQGLPMRSLRVDGVPDAIGMASAIYLAGGCLTDPRESTWSFSFGQCDMITTGLEHFGYVYLASFLKSVAPLYINSLGVTDGGRTGSSAAGDSDSSQAGVTIPPRVQQGKSDFGDESEASRPSSRASSLMRVDSPPMALEACDAECV